MIKLVIISEDATADMQLLSQQSDISASTITPTSVTETINKIGQQNPNIIVIEDGPDNSTADVFCHYISTHYSDVRCLILTDQRPTFEMLRNSGFKARGYITSEQRHLLARAVRAVHDGEAWLPRKLVSDMLDRFASSFIKPETPKMRLVT